MSKKTIWIVTKDGQEISRDTTKKMAELKAFAIGGTVHKYTVEWES